jgi:hypothetical protein
MNDRLSYLHFEISDQAEGIQEISEAIDTTGPLKRITLLLVHSELAVKEFSAEEGMISQVGVKLEGRDDSNVQDESRTTQETLAGTFAQTIPIVA